MKTEQWVCYETACSIVSTHEFIMTPVMHRACTEHWESTCKSQTPTSVMTPKKLNVASPPIPKYCPVIFRAILWHFKVNLPWDSGCKPSGMCETARAGRTLGVRAMKSAHRACWGLVKAMGNLDYFQRPKVRWDEPHLKKTQCLSKILQVSCRKSRVGVWSLNCSFLQWLLGIHLLFCPVR